MTLKLKVSPMYLYYVQKNKGIDMIKVNFILKVGSVDKAELIRNYIYKYFIGIQSATFRNLEKDIYCVSFVALNIKNHKLDEITEDMVGKHDIRGYESYAKLVGILTDRFNIAICFNYIVFTSDEYCGEYIENEKAEEYRLRLYSQFASPCYPNSHNIGCDVCKENIDNGYAVTKKDLIYCLQCLHRDLLADEKVG